MEELEEEVIIPPHSLPQIPTLIAPASTAMDVLRTELGYIHCSAMPPKHVALVGGSDANPSALLDHLALDPTHINEAERETYNGILPFLF